MNILVGWCGCNVCMGGEWEQVDSCRVMIRLGEGDT